MTSENRGHSSYPSSYNFNYARQGCCALKVSFTKNRKCLFLFPLITSILFYSMYMPGHLQRELLSEWITSSDMIEQFLTQVQGLKNAHHSAYISCKWNKSMKFKKASKLFGSKKTLIRKGEELGLTSPNCLIFSNVNTVNQVSILYRKVTISYKNFHVTQRTHIPIPHN